MKDDYLTLLRKTNRACMATVDAYGRPQVRTIDIMILKDNMLFFCTARGKEFYKELMATRYVAILLMNGEFQSLRLNALVIHLGSDKKLLEKIFTENTFMNFIYPHSSQNILDVFCIESASVEFCDFSNMFVHRTFGAMGAGTVPRKGYYISNVCTACGVCVKVCPQKCIDIAEKRYIITQAYCMHCGLCVERCPVSAILKK